MAIKRDSNEDDILILKIKISILQVFFHFLGKDHATLENVR